MGRRSRSVELSLLAVGEAALAMLGSQVAKVGSSIASASPAAHRVLYVGTFKGIATAPSITFSSIQAAVDAAERGDTIRVAPGDYHETGDMGANAPSPSDVSTGWYVGGRHLDPRRDRPWHGSQQHHRGRHPGLSRTA
jgi:hypothetical protein